MTKKRNFKLRKGRGSVFLLVVMFFGSAGLRVGLSAEAAMAEAEASKPAEMNIAENKPNPPHKRNDAEVSSLLSALLKREKKVKESELQLDIRAKSLEVAKVEIERRIAALKTMEEKLQATLALADGAAENDIARLTSVYENMKAPDAAALFEAMEPAFAAGFLGRMRPDAAAAILAGLEPKTAYTISILLAGRNAKVPKT